LYQTIEDGKSPQNIGRRSWGAHKQKEKLKNSRIQESKLLTDRRHILAFNYLNNFYLYHDCLFLQLN
jgi:hypothetical protein